MTAAEPSVNDLVHRVDDELVRFLKAKRDDLAEAAPMIDEIDRLVSAGGKRLRPLFCYWGFRCAGGGDSAEIIAAAAALELLHTFAIVHDDIMDASSERRGMPTTFAAHGTDVALLVGDLALVLADAALMESGFPPEVLVRAFAGYSRMRQQVIAGQYLDVVAATRLDMPVAEARRIAVLKSGRYSIEEPLVIGAALGGGSPSLIDALHRFGAPLGEAFQLRDDLLGTFGDPAQTGKPIDSDIREGKRHTLYALTLERLQGEDKRAFATGWGGGASLTDQEIRSLRSTMVTSGGKRAAEELLERLRDEAISALDDLGAGPEIGAALAELAHRATDHAL